MAVTQKGWTCELCQHWWWAQHWWGALWWHRHCWPRVTLTCWSVLRLWSVVSLVLCGKHWYLTSGSLFQDTLGLFCFGHFAYLSEKDHFSSPSLFFYTISPYHIEGWTFSNWLKTKMGASSSSASATGENAKNYEQSMSNYGLVNLADTGDSENGFTFNLVELFTCALAVLIGIFLLRFCCIRKRHQNLLRMQRNEHECHDPGHRFFFLKNLT